MAAVTGAVWMNWLTSRSSKTGCTGNFPWARASWWKTAKAAAIFSRSCRRRLRSPALRRWARAAVVPKKSSNRSASSRRIIPLATRNTLRPPCRRAPARFRSSSNPTKAVPSRLRAMHFIPAATAAPTVTRRLPFSTFTILTAPVISNMMAKSFHVKKR